jgi:hypothetical protein
MHVYQAEEGQVGLLFKIVLYSKDLDQILKHNPINTDISVLRVNISFCEPPKPISFDITRGIYFISLCHNEIRFLRSGNPIVMIHVIEGVRFTLMIFLKKSEWDFEGEPFKQDGTYLLLKGSTVE